MDDLPSGIGLSGLMWSQCNGHVNGCDDKPLERLSRCSDTQQNCVQMISSAVNVSNITVDFVDVNRCHNFWKKKKKREANMAMAIYIPSVWVPEGSGKESVESLPWHGPSTRDSSGLRHGHFAVDTRRSTVTCCMDLAAVENLTSIDVSM